VFVGGSPSAYPPGEPPEPSLILLARVRLSYLIDRVAVGAAADSTRSLPAFLIAVSKKKPTSHTTKVIPAFWPWASVQSLVSNGPVVHVIADTKKRTKITKAKPDQTARSEAPSLRLAPAVAATCRS
jgi:hypothetical protein